MSLTENLLFAWGINLLTLWLKKERKKVSPIFLTYTHARPVLDDSHTRTSFNMLHLKTPLFGSKWPPS